jgi:hypothetical protein
MCALRYETVAVPTMCNWRNRSGESQLVPFTPHETDFKDAAVISRRVEGWCRVR